MLLTRPFEDAVAFARLLPGWHVVISPVLRIVPVAHDAAALQAAPAVVLTSAHAVPAAGPGQGRLALCVGARTARVAAKAGFTVRQGTGDAEGLLPLIAAHRGPLIHPHGVHVARTLPVQGMIVYDQQPGALSDAAHDLLTRKMDVIVPLFSVRSAVLTSAAVGHAVARLWPVAISPAVMARWKVPAAGWAVACQPTADGVAAAMRRLPFAEQS